MTAEPELAADAGGLPLQLLQLVSGYCCRVRKYYNQKGFLIEISIIKIMPQKKTAHEKVQLADAGGLALQLLQLVSGLCCRALSAEYWVVQAPL